MTARAIPVWVHASMLAGALRRDRHIEVEDATQAGRLSQALRHAELSQRTLRAGAIPPLTTFAPVVAPLKPPRGKR